jgi:hypothetical protein
MTKTLAYRDMLLNLTTKPFVVHGDSSIGSGYAFNVFV